MFEALTDCRPFDRAVKRFEKRACAEILSPRVMRRLRLRLCYTAMKGLKPPYRRQAEFVAYRLRAGKVD